MNNEAPLTKRQRRELRRQEKAQGRLGGSRRPFPTGWVIGVLVVAAMVGFVWWLVASGSTGVVGNGLDMAKADTTDPFVGKADASVVVREFSDFQCPACLAAQPVIKTIIERYGDRIRFDYNDYPLVTIHKNALFAAEAAQCAHDQGKFWVYHDKLFDDQSQWEDLDKSAAKEKFKTYGADLGLEAGAFNACVDDESKKDIVQDDINQGNAAQVSATPTFFVNDQKITGVPQESAFAKMIDDELAAAAAGQGVEVNISQ